MVRRDRARPSHRNREYDPTTRGEFEAALETLVRTAAANGVRVEGGVGLRHPAPDRPDWGVEFTRLRKQRPGGTDEDRLSTDRE